MVQPIFHFENILRTSEYLQCPLPEPQLQSILPTTWQELQNYVFSLEFILLREGDIVWVKVLLTLHSV